MLCMDQNVNTKKMGAKVFGEFQNVVLEGNREDIMIRENNE